MTTIYGLAERDSGELRYVGKTDRDIAVRLAQHHKDAGNGRNRNRHLSYWIRKVGPEIFSIEETSDWVEAEQFWIAYYRALGCRLLNICPGGKAPPSQSGKAQSIETRAKLSAAFKGRPISSRHKSVLLKAGARTQFQAGHISWNTGGGCYSSETREKMSRAKRGKPSWNKGKPWNIEARSRMAAAKLGRTLPDHVKDKMRASQRMRRLREQHKGDLS